MSAPMMLAALHGNAAVSSEGEQSDADEQPDAEAISHTVEEVRPTATDLEMTPARGSKKKLLVHVLRGRQEVQLVIRRRRRPRRRIPRLLFLSSLRQKMQMDLWIAFSSMVRSFRCGRSTRTSMDYATSFELGRGKTG